MPLTAEGIRELMELGIVGEQMLSVIALFERDASRLSSRHASRDADEEGRAKAAIRSRNYRERRKNASRSPSRDERDAGSLTTEVKETSEVVVKGKRKSSAPRAKHPLPPDFQPKPTHFEAARRYGRNDQFVRDKFEDMRIWATSNGARKADWDQTLHGFIRRDAQEARNGNGISQGRTNRVAGPAPTGADAVLAGMGRIAGRIHDRRVSAGQEREVSAGDDPAQILDLEPARAARS
jgi:hypothetical protein